MPARHLSDVLPTVLSRYEDLSRTPLARRLAEVRIGSTDLWDAIKYEVADAIYDDVYRDLPATEAPTSPDDQRARRPRIYRDVRQAILGYLWQGQVGQELLVGLLSARFGSLGDLLQTVWARAYGRAGRPEPRRVDVLVAGSMYRIAVAALGPVLKELTTRERMQHLVVAHDDVLLRHGRAFERAGIRWCHEARFSDGEHRAAVGAVVERVRVALARAEPADGCVPPVVARKFLSDRYIGRLVTSFLVVREALSACAPAVVVIPDERQPLARLVAVEAGRHGLPVVSAPLDRDQIYRKTPLWGCVASTRILVFSPLAARFLGRGGISPDHFACVRRPPPATNERDRRMLRSRYREILKLPPRARIVLFASQGQAHNAILLPMLKACAAALPDVRLVIRPHPYEWPPLVRRMNRGLPVSTALGPEQVIQAVDVLITHSSFMAVEAALLGCPVVLLAPDSAPSLLPMLTEELARWVCTSEELRHTLQDLLAMQDRELRAAQERFRNEQAGCGDDASAVDVIAGLARTGRKVPQGAPANS